MKKLLSIIMLMLVLWSSVACGGNSKKPIINDSLDVDKTNNDMSNDEIYTNKVYYVGDEIPEGQYVVKCTKSNYGMDIIIFESEADYNQWQGAEKYTNGEYKRAEELYAWASFYVYEDECVYFSVKSGNIIVLDKGMCEFNKFNVKESNSLYSGVYIVGKDIDAGNININCPNEGIKVTIFENRNKYSDYHKSNRYTVGEESDALANNSLSSNYIYTGKSYSIRLEEGMILLINDGVGEYSIDKGPVIN